METIKVGAILKECTVLSLGENPLNIATLEELTANIAGSKSDELLKARYPSTTFILTGEVAGVKDDVHPHIILKKTNGVEVECVMMALFGKEKALAKQYPPGSTITVYGEIDSLAPQDTKLWIKVRRTLVRK